MQQEGKTPAIWERRPGVTLLIAGIVVYLTGAVAHSAIIMAFGLFSMLMAGLVGCVRTVRFAVCEMPTVRPKNSADAGQKPASERKLVDEMLEKHSAGRALTAVADAREREEDLRQFLDAVEREDIRQFVEDTLAHKAIAESGIEARHGALRQEVGAMIEEFKLTHDLALLNKIQALNREADRLKL